MGQTIATQRQSTIFMASSNILYWRLDLLILISAFSVKLRQFLHEFLSRFSRNREMQKPTGANFTVCSG